ncbi:branched-chain amino acid ABC transporter substrate-binding protein [candidate division TA06 bacterium]|uniref:Branched-chain amino acid ABC transporter substrate-binding protein n=1 Tax=candidate division TA06 bacterium TaxID=2250710 RepID=A0A933I773_UNCT6|nr:branched-chain amino acid ABC transporter substrate-binding protein [candidate division TA06 bacterium]
MKNNLFVAVVCALALALVASCSLGPRTIKIGVAGPMTGPQAKQGTDFLNGVRLAVEEWNARGGVLGKKIEVIYEDDRGDPKDAVAVANKLVNQNVAAVVGHYGSSCSIPASAIYYEAGIVQITPSSTNGSLTLKGKRATVFRACGRDDQQASFDAQYVREVLKKKRVAILDDKTTYGQGLAKDFEKNLGPTVKVVAYEHVTQGDKDFAAVLTKIKPLNPELIFYGGYYPEAGLIVTQMRRLGIRALFMSGDATIDQEYLNIAKLDAEGTYLSYGPDFEKLESAKKFIADYQNKYGQVGPYSLYAYDAANVALKGVELAGSAEGAKIAAAIHGNAFNGARGVLEFDENGDLKNSPYVVWVVKDGKFEAVK